MVMRLPEGDRLSMTKAKLLADLGVFFGGRVAEELIFGLERVTTGASSDIKGATEVARRMVTEWGMSEKLGPLLYGEPTQEVFLGHSVTQHKNMSDTTARLVDPRWCGEGRPEGTILRRVRIDVALEDLAARAAEARRFLQSLSPA